MRAVRRVYLDTNVIVHAFEKRDEISNCLVDLLARTRFEEPACFTSHLTYAEAIQKPYERKDEKQIDLYTNWLKWGTPTLRIGPIDADVLYHAAILRTNHRGLKRLDAIHVSTALLAGCEWMLTNDLRIPDEIDHRNERYGVSKGPLALTVVRPTVEAVRSLISALAS